MTLTGTSTPGQSESKRKLLLQILSFTIRCSFVSYSEYTFFFLTGEESYLSLSEIQSAFSKPHRQGEDENWHLILIVEFNDLN